MDHAHSQLGGHRTTTDHIVGKPILIYYNFTLVGSAGAPLWRWPIPDRWLGRKRRMTQFILRLRKSM